MSKPSTYRDEIAKDSPLPIAGFIPDGRWHHIVIVPNGRTEIVYTNGVTVEASPTPPLLAGLPLSPTQLAAAVKALNKLKAKGPEGFTRAKTEDAGEFWDVLETAGYVVIEYQLPTMTYLRVRLTPGGREAL